MKQTTCSKFFKYTEFIKYLGFRPTFTSSRKDDMIDYVE